MFSSFLKMAILHKNMFKISSASICSFFKIYLNSFFLNSKFVYLSHVFSAITAYAALCIWNFGQSKVCKNKTKLWKRFYQQWILRKQIPNALYVMYSFYLLHMINQYSVFKRFSNQQDQTVPIKKDKNVSQI